MTVSGEGFSAVPDWNFVKIDEHPCEVISSDYSQLQCHTIPPVDMHEVRNNGTDPGTDTVQFLVQDVSVHGTHLDLTPIFWFQGQLKLHGIHTPSLHPF